MKNRAKRVRGTLRARPISRTAAPVLLLLSSAAFPNTSLQAEGVRAKQSPAIADVRWPEAKKAGAGTPNIIIIMTDDVGFGASSGSNTKFSSIV